MFDIINDKFIIYSIFGNGIFMQESVEQTNKKLTFREKKPRQCPICDNSFFHEQLLTGGGRLIAGNLRKDLRRMYEKTKKYGLVYPLIYYVVVCPSCLYASFPEDFANVSKSEAEKISADESARKNYVNKLFSYSIDFNENRTLMSGAASYFLAISCYYFHSKETFPTFKKALASIRLSWVLEDLSNEYKNENFEKMIPFFQYKAKDFYKDSVEIMSNGKEDTTSVSSFGPDLDKNYGFEGMIYISGLLTSTFSFFIEDTEQREKELLYAKKILSKIFGSGKASKSKPSALLESIRELLTDVNARLKEIKP